MGVFLLIIKNKNVKYYKGIYNSQMKKVLGKKKVYTNDKSYQENQGKCLPPSAWAGLIYRLHDYSQLVFIGSKFQLGYFRVIHP